MKNKLKRQATKTQYSALRDRPVTLSRSVYFVDVHCHCLPGFDDGPGTMEQAVYLCRQLALDGVRQVIATVHQLGRYENTNSADQIRSGTGQLNQNLLDLEIPLAVAPGADVRVDERLVQMLDDDKILTLADNRSYILLELPHDTFIDISRLLDQLAQRSVRAVISHPERHPVIARNPELVRPWLEEYQAILQITAGSLAGDFGPLPEQVARYYLDRDMITVVATDAHNLTDRRPRMSAAYSLIEDQLGPQVACRLCMDNPDRVRKGIDVITSNSTTKDQD